MAARGTADREVRRGVLPLLGQPGVGERGAGLGVAHDEPHLGALGHPHPVHRALGPQPFVGRVGVPGEVVAERGEVERGFGGQGVSSIGAGGRAAGSETGRQGPEVQTAADA